MAEWVCSECGYAHKGDTAPYKCPQCGVPSWKFNVKKDSVASTSASISTIQGEIPQKSKGIVQGVSVVPIVVVAEEEIAIMTQKEVSKEIAKLNAEGKRVINVSAGTAVKSLLGVRHHIVLLWESV